MGDSRAVLAGLDPRVPAAQVAGVAAWAARAAADRAVVPARESASVLLLREVPAAPSVRAVSGAPGVREVSDAPSARAVPGGPVGPELEVFVQHRRTTMAFAAGMVTFPGGGRDPGDADLTACAVRELAEETGVRLDPAALHPWAHWITPEPEPRRYDTHFYVAALPPGQQASNTTSEAVRAHWVRPAVADGEVAAGRWTMLPPTRSLIMELAALGTLDAVLAEAADRVVGTVLPVPRRDDRGWVWEYPEVPS